MQARSVNPLPWWQSPVVQGGAIAVGALALGGVLGRLSYRAKHGPAIFADCNEAGLSGGTVGGVTYLEAMRGGATPDEDVPMVIAFHSLCSSPSGILNMFKSIGRARLIIPAGAYGCSNEKHRKWWKLGITKAMKGEELPGATVEWREEAQRMGNFISQIQRCRPTLGRPIVTGSSMGGEMTLLMASTHPRLLDSGVAVSGYVIPPFWNQRMAPVAMIHGDGDRTVPYDWAKDYAAHMESLGAPISFSSYSSDGHGVTKEMGKAWGTAIRGQVAKLNGDQAAVA